MPVMTAADARTMPIWKRQFVVMIARQVGIALVLSSLCKRPQFLASIPFRRVRLVKRHGLHPVVGLLEECRSPCFIGSYVGLDPDPLGGGSERGLTDCLGLEEIPGI